MPVFAYSIAAHQDRPSEGDGFVRAETIQQAVALVGHPKVNVYPLPANIRRLINREIISPGSSHRGPCCRTQRAIGLGHRCRLCRRGFERGDAPKATRIKMKAPRMMANPTARLTMVISLRPCVGPRNPWLNHLSWFRCSVKAQEAASITLTA